MAGYVSFGEPAKSYEAIAKLGGEPAREAGKIVASAVAQITATIKDMLVEWAKQPVYTVDAAHRSSRRKFRNRGAKWRVRTRAMRRCGIRQA